MRKIELDRLIDSHGGGVLASAGRLSGLVTQPRSPGATQHRGGNGERAEYHPCVAWDHLAEI